MRLPLSGKILLLSLALIPALALAQESGQTPLVPVISGPGDVVVGRTIVLDGFATMGVGQNTSYQWYRDSTPQPISRSIEAVYTPEQPGETTFRLVVRTTKNGQTVEAQTTKRVVVYSRKIVLIADAAHVSAAMMGNLRKAAAAAQTYLLVLVPTAQTLGQSLEQAIESIVAENIASLSNAEALVLWTDPVAGLQGLMRGGETSDVLFSRNSSIVVITDGGLTTLSRAALGPFAVLRPERIILTRPEAMNPLLTAANIPSFLGATAERAIETRVVDSSSQVLRPWTILSWLIDSMLTNGIPSQTIILLLMLPVIAMILTILKQVIGITSFGLFTPSIIALSFLALGWVMGLTFLIAILVASYGTRAIMQRWRLLHIPKMAIVITVVSITLLLLLAAAAALRITFGRDTIFILLIMSTLVESFLSLRTEEGWGGALIGTGETILAALLCVFIVQWPFLQSLILAYPELILLTIIVDVILGHWTGLRVIEYFRFREVFRHLDSEE